MKFLKKLFAKPSAPAKPASVQRAARIPVRGLRHVELVLNQPPGLRVTSILDVSETGVAITLESPDALAPNARIGGELRLAEGRLPVELQVMRTNSTLVGCRFVTGREEVGKLLGRYFDIELRAVRISPAPAHVLEEQPDGVPHWYSSDDIELYFVSLENLIVRAHLTLFGRHLEYAPDTGLQIGTTSEDPRDGSGPGFRGSTLIAWQKNGQIPAAEKAALFSMCARLIRSLPSLDERLRNELLRVFS